MEAFQTVGGHAATPGFAKDDLTAFDIPRTHSAIAAEVPGRRGPLGVQGTGEPVRERIVRLSFKDGCRWITALWTKKGRGKR